MAAPKLALRNISPSQGPTTGGTRVTLLGREFQSGMKVFFNAVSATEVTILSTNQAVVTAPPNPAGIVDVHVSLLDGRTALKRACYTYIQQSELRVDAGPDRIANEGSAVVFSVAVSGGAAPYSYSWDFGDGIPTSDASAPEHVYVDNGSYTVVVSVADTTGVVVRDSLLMSVANLAPSVSAGGPYSAIVGAPVNFIGSATDPSATDRLSLKFQWDFGDGSTGSTYNPNHVFNAVGSYIVMLTVTDKDGGVGTAKTFVTVSGASCTLSSLESAVEIIPFSNGIRKALMVPSGDDNYPLNAPVHAVPTADGGVAVAWSDTSGKSVNLTYLDSNGSVIGDDTAIPGRYVHGVVKIDDGYALTVTSGPGEILGLARVNANHQLVFRKTLIPVCNPIEVGCTLSAGFGTLLWTGNKLVSFFTEGVLYSSGGHNQDTLRYYSLDGTELRLVDRLACSHGMNEQLAIRDNHLAAVCLADAFPWAGINILQLNPDAYSTRDDFSYGKNVIPQTSILSGGTGYDVLLGNVVPSATGFWISFFLRSQSIGIIHVGYDGTIGTPIWIPAPTGIYPSSYLYQSAPRMVAFASGYLLVWNSYQAIGGIGKVYQQYAVRVDSSGNMIGAPERVSVPLPLNGDTRRDNMFNFANGDAGWATATGNEGVLTLVRIRNCK